MWPVTFHRVMRSWDGKNICQFSKVVGGSRVYFMLPFYALFDSLTRFIFPLWHESVVIATENISWAKSIEVSIGDFHVNFMPICCSIYALSSYFPQLKESLVRDGQNISVRSAKSIEIPIGNFHVNLMRYIFFHLLFSTMKWVNCEWRTKY